VAAVAAHHERLDGSGYPVGLSGDAITAAGRVVGVADAFVAMVRPSAVGLSMDPAGAFRVLRFATRNRFDERAIVALADLIAEGTIGGREATRPH
jgi:HD-GYP domain-containing protein (c-di-GMP phosphodiesterase class II)